jgi:hypothetical protein
MTDTEGDHDAIGLWCPACQKEATVTDVRQTAHIGGGDGPLICFLACGHARRFPTEEIP